MNIQLLNFGLKLIAITIVLTSVNNLEAKARKDFSVSLSPDEKRMVVYSYRDEALPDLYISNTDGTQEINLTKSEEFWDIEPAWSPVSEQIAFSRGPSMNHMNIYVINSDGSHLRQLTDANVSSSGPSWSKDGKTILFNRWYDPFNSKIIKLDVETGKETILTEDLDWGAFKPQFSNDQQFIIFTAKKTKNEKAQIYMMDTDGSNVRQISHLETDAQMAKVNPVNNTIIYNGAIEGGNAALYSFDPETQKITTLTTDPDSNYYFVNFSRDGKTLYYSYGDWDTNFFIYESELNGKPLESKQITGVAYLNELETQLKDNLEPFVGKWTGLSTQGRSKGHFREETIFSWDKTNKFLNVEMQFYWDNEPMGSSQGIMAYDLDNNKAYFNLVMEDGTVVMQQQTNTGDKRHYQMDVQSSGNGSRFPKNFKTELIKVDENNWKSKTIVKIGEDWETMSVHEFTRKSD